MKIIYTQRKPRADYRKHLILAFNCLILVFVMCFFGALLIKQKMDYFQNTYEQIDSSCGEALLDAIEAIAQVEEI